MRECKGYEEFAEYIINTLTADNVLEFATTKDYEDATDKNDYSDWYFLKLIKVDGYGSRFILIDFCGGEEAFVIPLSACGGFDGNLFDEEDFTIIKVQSSVFFDGCINLGKDSYSVWVDDETDD